jgi:hypothetical protein
MKAESGIYLGGLAILIYLTGGVGTFGGLALIFFMKGTDLFGWGDGASLGYLFVSVGLILSILGVLVMRLLRNRRLA